MGRPSNPISLQILTTFLILLSCSRIPTMCLKVEKQALLEFKKQLIDPLNHLESWKDFDFSGSGSGPDSNCRFYGVVCDRETGLVTEIQLDNKTLSGFMSPSISQLKNLKTLNLSNNYINATVPDLSGLASLEILDLADNYFSGPFPGWIGNLTGLAALSLGDNDYDEGEIPESIGRLKNLSFLYLGGSNLKGRIPESIFGLEKLGTLDISKNAISGEFPASIVKLKSLVKIELYQNNLTGELPEGLADLALLEEFDVSNNQLFGEMPQRIGQLKNLTVFHVFKNNFSGEFPAGFGQMKRLVSFSIYTNGFSGEFPPDFGRFSPLNSIDISENRFSGPFPEYLCRNKNLDYLLALDNFFSGRFPVSYAECTSLLRLRVSNNRLNGSIPDRVWALPELAMMDFSENNFSGRISPLIGQSSQLKELVLSSNEFSGKLPGELGNLTQLERIYLDDNKLSGEIPLELGGLKQIASLQMEGNEFTGSIPLQLSGCPRLADLNLGSNFLTGNIPGGFSEMPALNSLNFSGNKLTGSIPASFDKLRLSSVDLSNNRLSGRVPPYFFTVAGDKALSGNNNLCIDETESNKRLANSKFGFCEGRNGKKRIVESKHVAFVFVVVFALVVLLGVILLVRYYSPRRSEHEIIDSDREENITTNSLNWRLESFQNIEFDPDEICALDEKNLIGSGSSGKVYRLDSGSGSFAVKRLWKGSGVRVMEAETEVMSKIRHRNILQLYACLTRDDWRFLVFKYMENGNLSEALHSRELKSRLDWGRRYRIAVGGARGVAYLHHDCSPPVIHRDIKSTNILLDEDYEANIADFGVAKVVDGVGPGGSEMSCFAGTHGYMAPEMGYSVRLTEKSDVYSFGVVLMELVTGKRPVEEEYGEGRDIVFHVSTRLDSRESAVGILDRNVVFDEGVEDDMIKVLKVAVLCTDEVPSKRPSMKEVVKMLVEAEPRIVKFDGLLDEFLV